jgi:hypothetical protein
MFCQFLEEDLKTPLPKKLTLKEPAKLFEIAERGRYKLTLENRQSIENAIAMGRGSIRLDLKQEQYERRSKNGPQSAARAELCGGVKGIHRRDWFCGELP